MIIAWYPGGGGNRFYKWLSNSALDFKSKQVYDYLNPYQIEANRYPGRRDGLVDTPVVFTHCVNYDFLTKIWPSHDKIYLLEVDLYQSLRRQWHLIERKVNINQHTVGGPFSAITWHDDYYNEYPFQVGNSILVNQQTFPDFFNMIQNELRSIVCPEFDFALQMFKQHGSNAPILDLYKEHYERR